MRHPRHGLDIVRRHRIFQPHRLDLLQFTRQTDDVLRVVPPMALDGEIGVGAERFADRLHALHDAPVILVRQVARVGVVARLRELRVGLGRARRRPET